MVFVIHICLLFIFLSRLECVIQADLKPIQIQWLLNGLELIQSDRIEMNYFEDLGLANLKVHSVGLSDSGEYSCVVAGIVIEPDVGIPESKTITSSSEVSIKG